MLVNRLEAVIQARSQQQKNGKQLPETVGTETAGTEAPAGFETAVRQDIYRWLDATASHMVIRRMASMLVFDSIFGAGSL